MIPTERSLRLFHQLLLGVALLTLGFAAACGDSGGDDGDGDNGAGEGDEAMVQLFAEKGCAECHGAEGEGVEGVANSELAGTRMIIQQFSTRVRNGKGAAMPAYSSEQITDEEIRALWEWLRTK